MKLSNKRMNGFTLAEVLITLGIIGVVAAMTMPTLMNSTQGAQYKAAYKKALSAISQGVTLNVALDGASFADTTEASATTATANKTNTADILRARMNVVNSADAAGYTFPTVKASVCTATTDGKTSIVECGDDDTPTETALTTNLFLFLNDGIVFGFNKDDFGCTNVASESGGTNKPCYGAIDVNGAKGPNKVVACDTGTDTDGKPCTVNNPTDIYPVVYYDQTILPASNAAKAVLYGK